DAAGRRRMARRTHPMRAPAGASRGASRQRRSGAGIHGCGYDFSFALGRSEMDDETRRAEGMRVRRSVLGDAHVDASVARTTEFTAEFQDLITRYAWGEIWTRPELPRNVRSLVTMAMLIALGRDDEFRMHVRASVAA